MSITSFLSLISRIKRTSKAKDFACLPASPRLEPKNNSTNHRRKFRDSKVANSKREK